MKMLINTVSYWWVLLLPLTFITCSKDETPSGPAQLMFINGLTDGRPSTVIIADSSYAALTAPFSQFTQYQKITGGNQSFKLHENTFDSIIATKSFDISTNKNYTLMAAGTTAKVELIIKEDDLSFPDTTKAYIRLINLSENSLPMNMSITAGPDLVTNVSYKSISDFTPIDPSKYYLTIQSGNTIIVNTTNLVSLLAKKKYSILITGFVNQVPKAAYNIIVNK